jgi:hypothetical protein
MKITLVGAAIALTVATASTGVALSATAAAGHLATGSDVCAPLDSGKIDTRRDPMTVHVVAPAGKVIVGYCVKAGSVNQGEGPRYYDIEPGVSAFDVAYIANPKRAVSHYSLSFAPAGTPTASAAPATTAPATPTATPTVTAPPAEPSSTPTTAPDSGTKDEDPKDEDPKNEDDETSTGNDSGDSDSDSDSGSNGDSDSGSENSGNDGSGSDDESEPTNSDDADDADSSGSGNASDGGASGGSNDGSSSGGSGSSASDGNSGFDWNWTYPAPTCSSLTVPYPSDIPADQANDVNVRFHAASGDFTINFHNNGGTWSGTRTFVFADNPRWPSSVGSYSVVWVQVGGTNYHWSGSVSC